MITRKGDRADKVYVGTSSWTAPSWVGPFYPPGTPSSELLPHYARRFRTVEIDATWYRIPSVNAVETWLRKTPDEFVFAAKVPQTITHERVLRDCEEELEQFVSVMQRLEHKLGPLLLQFPHFGEDTAVPTLDAFLERLVPFLPLLPADVRFALEVRNKAWLRPELFEALRAARVALAWIDHPKMPTPRFYGRLPGAVTADFLYLRWLGDRHGIERATTTWDRLIYDRRPQLAAWAETLDAHLPRLHRAYAYANNHYAGCGYQTADLFLNLLD